MNIQNILIHKNKSIIEALKQLNGVLYKDPISRLILFVLDDDQRVIGSLTDGDIRRSLIKSQDLTISVGEICNQNFTFAYNTDSFRDLKSYLKKDIKILPILDSAKKLVKILDLKVVKSQLPLECMIMAGGRGKRLSPLTDSVPKPMLPLGGKPIIEHNIDRLIAYGIEKIYISVKYLGEQIKDYFGDGSSKGISIEYVWEDQPLGTAGALALVERFESPFVLLMNSDLFSDVDFEEMYLELIQQDADMVVASTEYKVDIPYAVFDTEGTLVKSFQEKPTYVYHSNAGVYILKNELIRTIAKNTFCDITEVMERLVQNGGKLVYNPIRGFWIDIGSPVDYKRAQELIKHF